MLLEMPDSKAQAGGDVTELKPRKVDDSVPGSTSTSAHQSPAANGEGPKEERGAIPAPDVEREDKVRYP